MKQFIVLSFMIISLIGCTKDQIQKPTSIIPIGWGEKQVQKPPVKCTCDPITPVQTDSTKRNFNE